MMGDFPKQGGVAKQTPKPAIKSGTPAVQDPHNTNPGGVAWGGPGKGTGNNDKNKAK